MRLLKLTLKNYIGIYNGLGLEGITIDFSKCKNKMLVIKGDNGSGKSTLFKALHPLPDSNSSFIPRKPAAKQISYIDDSGIIYDLSFIHNVKNNDERETTKAYITKIVDNTIQELNPNGNVSSFKDILFGELKLDPNFISLSQLSSDDRGLGDKKPAERKKFVGSILEQLGVYNDIYKTMTKRSSLFKTMINSLSSKIDSIGDEEYIKNTIISIENNIKRLTESKYSELDKLSRAQAKVESIELNYVEKGYNSIQTLYTTISNCIRSDTDLLNRTNSTIKNLYTKSELISTDNIDDVIMQLKLVKQSFCQKVDNLTNRSASLLADKDAEAKQLQIKLARLQGLNSDVNLNDLISIINESKTKIKYCEDIFNQIGINPNELLTKNEYIIGLNTIKDIKDMINTIKDSFDYDIMVETIEAYIRLEAYPDLVGLENEIVLIENKISADTIEYSKFSTLLNTTELLSLRPSKCKINDCNFIKDALQAKAYDPKGNMNKIEDNLAVLNRALVNNKKQLERNKKIAECINYFKSIIRAINTNKGIILKLPIRDIFEDINIFVVRILNGDNFKEIDVLYQYLDYANIFEEYSITKANLYRFESDFKLYESKHEVIDEISNDIQLLNDKVDAISKELESNNEIILDIKTKMIDVELKEESLKTIKQLTVQAESLSANIVGNAQTINKFEKDIKDIDINSLIIETCKSNIYKVDNELNPIMEQREQLKHGLVLLNDYNHDLTEYSSKYDKIETIKLYSSPTTGIQTLFMELYMNQTISIGNQLLALLFDGKYTLLPFKINESEFSIPCIGSGLVNDDISSMSSSEISCISMILSFALLYQSSSKLNILKLDEIDAALDSVNRRRFIILLEQMMEMLKCEQCIIISHNNELSLDTSDVVLLRHDNTDPNGGNIIYKFQG